MNCKVSEAKIHFLRISHLKIKLVKQYFVLSVFLNPVHPTTEARRSQILNQSTLQKIVGYSTIF